MDHLSFEERHLCKCDVRRNDWNFSWFFDWMDMRDEKCYCFSLNAMNGNLLSVTFWSSWFTVLLTWNYLSFRNPVQSAICYLSFRCDWKVLLVVFDSQLSEGSFPIASLFPCSVLRGYSPWFQLAPLTSSPLPDLWWRITLHEGLCIKLSPLTPCCWSDTKYPSHFASVEPLPYWHWTIFHRAHFMGKSPAQWPRMTRLWSWSCYWFPYMTVPCLQSSLRYNNCLKATNFLALPPRIEEYVAGLPDWLM